jgi:DNA-binding CsgD family transcriptional regulator
LVLLAQGWTAAEIGAQLAISPRTARMHLDVLRQKLGVPRVRELPAAYRRQTGRDPFAEALD